MSPGPLQAKADGLLRRLRGNPTRGDVVAVIQAAVVEVIEDLAAEMCDGRSHAGGSCPTAEDFEDEICGADRLLAAWDRVRPRLWGE